MKILPAEQEDLNNILQLQYIAYRSEAELCQNFSIPPLTETLAQLEQEYQNGVILKALGKNDKLVGSVRGKINGDTLLIGKLIVHPEQRGKGIGTELLTHLENMFPDKRRELFTSTKSVRNIALYEKLGYTPFKQEQMSPNLTFVYLEKWPAPQPASGEE